MENEEKEVVHVMHYKTKPESGPIRYYYAGKGNIVDKDHGCFGVALDNGNVIETHALNVFATERECQAKIAELNEGKD